MQLYQQVKYTITKLQDIMRFNLGDMYKRVTGFKTVKKEQ